MMSEPTPGSWRSALGLNVTGDRAIEFLQGYLTCNLDRFADLSTLPMSLCNLKGRVIVSGWAHQHASDHVELIVHKSLTARLQEVLGPYARLSRCDLAIAAGPPSVVISAQPDTAFEYPARTHTTSETGDISELLERRLIEMKFAWVSAETSEKFLPQVLDLHHQGAVDFDKGCYLGQEIVARAQFRGSVKKSLVEFTWQSTCPAVGAVNEDGHTVISITSSVGKSDEGQGLAVT